MLILGPTAGTTELDGVPNLVLAWQELLQQLTDVMLFGPRTGHESSRAELSAVEELKAWGRDRKDLRYYDPVTTPAPPNSAAQHVHWGALPTRFDQDPRFGGDKQRILRFLDEPQPDRFGSRQVLMRQQDEYCEWVVQREGDKIRKVIFTSEPALLYDFVFDPKQVIQSVSPAAPDPQVDKTKSQDLLVQMYRRRTGNNAVQLAQLVDGNGNYDPYNQLNREHAVHLHQSNNSLGAEINIAVRASLLRARAGTGALKTDAADLIACAGYGEAARQSDPAIGAAVNQFARENRQVTLADPIGLYMTGLDTTGWTAPGGVDPQSLWKVVGGTADPDPDKAMIVRAEFGVDSAQGFTVSDVKIGPRPIVFGGQIADGIGMRLAAMVGPVTTLPKPRPIGCIDEQVAAAPAPVPLANSGHMMSRRKQG